MSARTGVVVVRTGTRTCAQVIVAGYETMRFRFPCAAPRSRIQQDFRNSLILCERFKPTVGGGVEILLLLGIGLLAASVSLIGGSDDPEEQPDPDVPDVEGTPGNDALQGQSGDVVRGLGGNDSISGNEGFVYGGGGRDGIVAIVDARAFGDDGDDQMTLLDDARGFGGAGDDIVNGLGRSSVYGGDGADWVTARDGAVGSGGLGEDSLAGYDRATVYGGYGEDDLLVGGDGTGDGGAGNDSLVFFSGATVSGGSGADLFAGVLDAFEQDDPDAGAVEQTITDFTPGEDHLLLHGITANPDSISIDEDAQGTRISVSTRGEMNGVVILDGVSGLTAEDLRIRVDGDSTKSYSVDVRGGESDTVVLEDPT